MPARPRTILPLLAAFAPVFSRRVWRSARLLAAGALLTPGKRTVAAALRVVGLADARRFERYHRVLNRDRWSGMAVARVLLRLLVAAFVPTGPLVVGMDETIERRRGAKHPLRRVPGPRASIGTPCAPASPTSSRRAGCGGRA